MQLQEAALKPGARLKLPAIAGWIAAAAACGMVLRLVVGLEPVWWLAWFAPAPLLVLALRATPRLARVLTLLAGLIAVSVNYHYFQIVLQPAAAILVIAAQALLWAGVVATSRRVVLRYRAWWTVFAYPVLWVAFDTLAAALLADGNWGSLAYSQSENLPMLQVVALFGLPGLLFLVALVPSSLALALTPGLKLRHAALAYAIPALLLAGAFGFGSWRLQQTPASGSMSVGVAVIDRTGGGIGPAVSSAYANDTWTAYERLTASLAARGARLVVLPEKIAMLDPASAALAQARLAALAARHRVWVEVGVGLAASGAKHNLSWLFAPDGTLARNYQKHRLAPPERDFVAGTAAAPLQAIDGIRYGLAICKDMHFASLGREQGRSGASVMLVPAWDFYFDRWMSARMTLVRGVESGYSVVRAAREGLLTVSDPYGRVLGEAESSTSPVSLLVELPIQRPLRTFYQVIGDAFGWLCVMGAAVLIVLAARPPQTRPSSGDIAF